MPLLAAYCCEGQKIVAHAVTRTHGLPQAAGFDTLLYFSVLRFASFNEAMEDTPANRAANA